MRRDRHAYFDVKGSVPAAAHEGTPDDAELKLGSLSLSGAPLSAEVPGLRPREPSVLSIGDHQQEPIPSVPEERELAQRAVDMAGGVFKTLEDAKPPPATSDFRTWDQGVAGPDVLRLSCYNFPASKALADKIELPLGLICRPFACAVVPRADFSDWHARDDSDRPIVDQPGPPRCRRCRAYMNPSMQFTQSGSRFVCNLCLFASETPENYWQPLAADGRRIDVEERPELAAGVYDLEVPSDYGIEKPPNTESKGRRYVIAIDCSQEAVAKNIPALAAFAIKQSLTKFQPETQLAILLFSRTLSLIRFRDTGFEMLVQPGTVESPVIPPDAFTSPDNTGLATFLDSISDFADGAPASCYGTALEAAYNALPDGQGRVMVVLAALPNEGPGKLTRRDPALLKTPLTSGITGPDRGLFEPTSPFYRDIGIKYGAKGIGCDLFAFSQGYIDLANVGYPAFETGGAHHAYPRFVAERDSRAYLADWLAVIEEPLLAVGPSIAIRCSNGLQVQTHIPSHPSGDPQHWGIMDSRTVLTATVVHDGPLDPKLDVHFQIAVLYTAADDGTRRIRVVNGVAGVADNYKAVFKYIDNDAVVGLMSRQALAAMPLMPLRDIRDEVLAKSKAVFVAARKNIGRTIPLTQLLMPSALRELLPMTLALAKNVALGPREFSTDARTQESRRLRRLPPAELSIALYPRMIRLRDGKEVRARAMDVVDLAEGSPILASDGQRLWLYSQTSAHADPQLLADIIGADASAYLDELPEFDNPNSVQAREIAEKLMLQSGRSWLPLQLAREALDGATYQFSTFLSEDMISIVPAYTDYAQQVHQAAKKDL